MELAELRRSYQQLELDEASIDPSPIVQLRLWLYEAKHSSPGDWFECNAMTLSTSAANGEVFGRIVLLKSLNDDGLTFFTNYKSAKGRQLAINPHASLVFYWPHLERQVRIQGKAEQTSADISDEYFASRPRGSQLGAHASPQSQPVSSRESLEKALAAIEQKFGDGPVPRPSDWGGYLLRPYCFEVWQGRPNRMHDRIAYRQQGDHAWDLGRLGP